MNYERRNCPPGGIKFNRRKYRAGQFIPGTVMFQHQDPRYARAAAHIDGVQTEYAEPVPEGWGEPAPADESFDPSQREYNALLAAIHADPLDATGHFALSDWHAERGEQDEADFRKAMGEWVGRFGPNSSPFAPHRQPTPWRASNSRDQLPAGVRPENIESLFNGHIMPDTEEEHHPDYHWYTNSFNWPSYQGMEESFRRAFMANRERRRQQNPEQFSAYGPQDETGTFLEPQGGFGDRQDVWGENADTLTWDDPNKKLKTPDVQDENALPATDQWKTPRTEVNPIRPADVQDEFGHPPASNPVPVETDDEVRAGLVNHFNGLSQNALQGLFANFGIDPQSPSALSDLVEASLAYFNNNPQQSPQEYPQKTASQSAQTASGLPIDTESLYADPVRKHLGTSEITQWKRLGGKDVENRAGRNESWVVTFPDGSEGVFKNGANEDPGLRVGIEAGTYYRREVASSLVADLLGFGDLVPKTTFRDVPGMSGSIQHFVRNATPAHEVDKPSRFDGKEDLARAAVFDYIMGNSDRHPGNWLLDSSGKLALIDNGLSLPTEYSSTMNHILNTTKYLDEEGNVISYASPFQFIRESAQKGLAVPDLSHLRDSWPEVEKALRDSGIEEAAIRLAAKRFDVVTNGKYKRIMDLPAYWTGSSIHTLPALRTYF